MRHTLNANIMRMIGLSFIICHLSFSVCACSEKTDEENEYANWKARNDAYFATLEAKYSAQADGQWLRLKSFSKDPATAKDLTECIYAQVLEKGTGTESPLYTDSVRVSYRGRLIPTDAHPDGYVFDGTAYGEYNAKTNATVKFLLSDNLVAGFKTALFHMHRGDTWRVYIPYNLGYGSVKSGSIPAYSTLIFELTLVDFQRAGHTMEPYSARAVNRNERTHHPIE